MNNITKTFLVLSLGLLVPQDSFGAVKTDKFVDVHGNVIEQSFAARINKLLPTTLHKVAAVAGGLVIVVGVTAAAIFGIPALKRQLKSKPGTPDGSTQPVPDGTTLIQQPNESAPKQSPPVGDGSQAPQSPSQVPDQSVNTAAKPVDPSLVSVPTDDDAAGTKAPQETLSADLQRDVAQLNALDPNPADTCEVIYDKLAKALEMLPSLPDNCTGEGLKEFKVKQKQVVDDLWNDAHAVTLKIIGSSQPKASDELSALQHKVEVLAQEFQLPNQELDNLLSDSSKLSHIAKTALQEKRQELRNELRHTARRCVAAITDQPDEFGRPKQLNFCRADCDQQKNDALERLRHLAALDAILPEEMKAGGIAAQNIGNLFENLKFVTAGGIYTFEDNLRSIQTKLSILQEMPEPPSFYFTANGIDKDETKRNLLRRTSFLFQHAVVKAHGSKNLSQLTLFLQAYQLPEWLRGCANAMGCEELQKCQQRLATIKATGNDATQMRAIENRLKDIFLQTGA